MANDRSLNVPTLACVYLGNTAVLCWVSVPPGGKGQLRAGMLGADDRIEAMDLKVFGPPGSSWVGSLRTSQDCTAHDRRDYSRAAHQGTQEFSIFPTLGTSSLSAW